VAVVGHEKGNDTKSRIKHNFGMAMPEGYRKAVRLFDLADRFQLPVISFADTQGAYPGVGAEERGQAEAIARSTQASLALGVPFVAVIIGEGMSGGALGIAVANRVYMLEHSIYAVISPEGCASILWRSSDKAQDAAAAMRITAADLLDLKVIDGIVPEPLGGAHRAPEETIQACRRHHRPRARRHGGIIAAGTPPPAPRKISRDGTEFGGVTRLTLPPRSAFAEASADSSRANARMSPTRSFGRSSAAKWPPSCEVRPAHDVEAFCAWLRGGNGMRSTGKRAIATGFSTRAFGGTGAPLKSSNKPR
jgi:hypothetical protein